MASEEKPIQEVSDQVIEEISNKHDIPATYEPPSPLTGSYLLIILGEPHSSEHKDIILQRLLKGLLSWNVLECHVDLEEELNNITNHAPEGEAARHGERLIQFASENLVTEILIHPQYNTLIQCMRNLLSSFTRHRHIIHSGYTFSGNGSWILQDATFSVSDFAEALQDYEVQRVMRAYPDTISLEIHCATSGHWNKLPDKSYAKLCKIHINSVDILDSGSEKLNAFINYLSPLVAPASLNELMDSSDVVGNIRFSHPTLYVFPGGQGDAALFGINGFNMLVDGGFNRKSCFWDFTRHLDRLDAVLMTRINNANIQGLSSIIERKAISNVYPQIGYFFTNIPESKPEVNLESDKDSDPLIVNLFERGQSITSNLKSINLKPTSCYKDIEPINLYHKVGHGTLDMYVISPSKDSKEVKEFLQKWNARDQNLFATKQSKEFQFPLQNLVSICAMLVWQPANPEETITRILFPGSTPDYKIMEGLDKMKHLEFVKHPVCTANQIEASFSSTILSKKQLKSALTDKSHEPILPSKVTKTIVAQEKDNKMVTETKTIIKTEKETSAVDSETKVCIDKDEIKTTKVSETEKDNKTASDVKPIVKSRIDSRPPKSMDRKLKKDSSTEKKSSPITTPKKEQKQTKEKEIKPKVISRMVKTSPSSTPAKSTKEANNRKVFESKQKTVKTAKKEVSVEKKEVKEIKIERKAISRRSKPAAGSPMKTVKSKTSKDTVIRRPKTDKGATSDSSVVSSPSADDMKVKKPIDEKQMLLDDLIEEQEAVREIEAVLQRSEDRNKSITSTEHRTIIIDKQDSTTEADEDEEYIIIEKEEQYTEESVNEPESTELTGKEEAKHQRDSQESEKKRKPSIETTEEEEQKVVDKPVVESVLIDVKTEEQEETIQTVHKMNGDIPKALIDSQEDIKSDEGSPITDEKQSSDEKKTEIKEELEKIGDIKETDIVNVPESQTTAESGATTAPTLPEDEHVTLDEIKENVVIEEKYIKEETKETKETQVIVTAVDESIDRIEKPKPMQFDAQHPHLRELNIKTPDEVADLPVHEEADIAVDESPAPGSRKTSLRKTEEPLVKQEQPIKADDEIEEEKIETKDDKLDLKLDTDVVPTEKKTPSPTGRKTDDSLTKIEAKIASPVEKIEYKVEDLGQDFENTLKDVTGELKKKSSIDDIQPQNISEVKEDILPSDENAERKSASPTVILKDDEIKQEINESERDLKSTSPTKPIELERKESVVEKLDEIKSEKNDTKTPSPDLKEKIVAKSPSPELKKEEIKETKEIKEIKEIEQIEVHEIKESIDILSTSPEKLEEIKSSPTKDITETKDETVSSKSPSPELKEQVIESHVLDKVTTIDSAIKIETKRTSLIDEAENVEEEKIESKEKSKSPSPTKDELISESRKTSVSDQILKEEIGRQSVSPIEKQLVETPPKETSPTENIGTDAKDSTSGKSGSPTDLNLKSSPYTEVYDYSHPFDAPYPQELRETHITTVESPIVEKSKLIDLQVIDKTITETSLEADDSELNDIKEEEEDERISPPSVDHIESAAPKIIAPLEVQSEPPRAISPREQEVLKIVANVAEVLKSEKDIEDIIPDFNEDELEKNIMQRASTPEVFSVDSERKGSTIDVHDLSASLSEAKTSTTSIDEKEQHEIAEKHQATFKKESIDSDIQRKESFISEVLDDSRRESAISTFSEKDFTKDESTLDKFSRSNSSLDLKHDELDVKSTEHSDITQIEQNQSTTITEQKLDEKDDITKSAIDLKLEDDNATVQRMLVTASSEDGGEEIEICAEGTIKFSPSATTPETFSGKITPEVGHEELEKKPHIETTLDVDDLARRESIISRQSDRPESVMSHFSDTTEPELKETCSSPEKQIHEKLDEKLSHSNSSGKSTGSPSLVSSSHGSVEIEGIKTPNGQKEETTITTIEYKETEQNVEIVTVKSDSTESITSDKAERTTPPAIESEEKEKSFSLTEKLGEVITKIETTCQEIVSAITKEETDDELKVDSDEKEKADEKIESRPESSASKKEVQKPSISPAKEEQIETKTESRSQSVASVITEEKIETTEAQKSRSESIVSEKPDISGKTTPADVSRPESVTSDKKDDEPVAKSPSPSVLSDKKASLEKVDDKPLIKEEASRPESAVSSASAKDAPKSPAPSIEKHDEKPDKDEKSRPQSAVSSASAKDAPKSPTPSIEKHDEKPDKEEKSRPQSAVSSASAKDAPKSPTPPIEKHDEKHDKEEKSRPESAVSNASAKDVSKSPSPPNKEEHIVSKPTSRSQSIVSEENVDLLDGKKSRSQSIVSEKECISGKATPINITRPESSAKDDLHPTKSPSPLIESNEKELKPIDDSTEMKESVSRPESSLSKESVKDEPKTQSPQLNEEHIEKTVASVKLESHTSSIVNKIEETHVVSKSPEQKEPSRPSSSINEENVGKISLKHDKAIEKLEEKLSKDESQKSRSQSIVSDQDDSKKATPLTQSRPESSVSHIDEKTELKSLIDSDEKEKANEKVESRPESSASMKDVQKPSASPEKEEQIETKTESRSQSVASVIIEEKIETTEAQKSRSQSIVSEKPDVSGKTTPADVSRPESVTSDKKDDEPIAKSPSPSVLSDKKASLEKADDKPLIKEEASRPESAISNVSGKDAVKSLTPSIEKHDEKPDKEEKSRPQSAVSSASAKDGPKSPTPSIEKHDEKHDKEEKSRPESAVSNASAKDVSKSPSPPNKEEHIVSKPTSRSQSIVSEENVDLLDGKKSRSQSIVSEKPDISGKTTPADASRPESVASDKKGEEIVTKSPSPPNESVKRDSLEKADEKVSIKSEASRPESAASDIEIKDEKKSFSLTEKLGEVITKIETKCQEIVSAITQEETDDELKIDSDGKEKTDEKIESRPESSASIKEVQKPSISPAKEEQIETKIESRSQSVASVITEEKIETTEAQKSRSQSIVSEKSDILGKTTPADVSRPESVTSDKKDDEPVAKSPSPSVLSDKKASLEKADDKPLIKEEVSRPESAISNVSEKDAPKSPTPSVEKQDEKPDKEEKSRPESAVSNISAKDAPKSPTPSIEKHDEKPDKEEKPRPESAVSNASAKDAPKSPTPSVEKLDEKPDKEEISRPESAVSNVSAKDVPKSPSPPNKEKSEIITFIKEEKKLTTITTDTENKSKIITEEKVIETTSKASTVQDSSDKVDTVKEEKSSSDANDLVGVQIATGSTIRGVHDSTASKTSDKGAIEQKIDIHDLPKKSDMQSILKESRSKSVASISVFGTQKPPQSHDLEKITEVSKDDFNLADPSRKASDISTLIEDIKKIDEKIITKPSEKIETSEIKTIAKDEHLTSLDSKLSQQKSSHSSLESTTSDKGSIETVLESGALGSLETKEHSFDLPVTTKEVTTTVQVVSKDISTVKNESKTYRDSDNESLPISDDEAVTSSQKYSYEDYQFERSNSELSKKSDLDIDDSQNDIPPQYGSQEFKSAVSVATSHTMDPMSASFYGELPSGLEQIVPVTISTVRTVITKQFDSHTEGEPIGKTYTTQETITVKPGDHKFLEEADLGFEKALEEHRQARGPEVMSTITSKYEFKPSEFPADKLAEASSSFPLTDVKSPPKEQTKEDASATAEALARQLEDDLKKAEERVASWGKPLGLPVSINENPPTPKKERKLASAKIKLNNEKNIQKRSNSPNKNKKITPIYMDLTYVPHNGNSYYSHVEFFKRVRARYYVFSGTEPSRDVYNALLEAKQTWEDKSLEVTIIPTYDTDVLGYWVAENEEMLAKYHIDLSPSASRCTINLQDHETCCAAYRLEF